MSITAEDAARRKADFDALVHRLETGAPELVANDGAGPILADIGAAAKPGEWNAAVARLVTWALHRLAKAEGRNEPPFRVAVGHLSFFLAGGFVPPIGRPASVIDARHDAMILQAEGARTMPQAVAALAKWDSGGEDGSAPAAIDTKQYDRLRKRAARAAEAAGIELAPGRAFRGEANDLE